MNIKNKDIKKAIKLKNDFLKLYEETDIISIEGAGGIMVSNNEDDFRELAQMLNCQITITNRGTLEFPQELSFEYLDTRFYYIQ